MRYLDTPNRNAGHMILADLPTPCLILDRQILQHNITRMAQAVARHGVALRPHMKTAKSIDVARMALAANPAKPGVETFSKRNRLNINIKHSSKGCPTPCHARTTSRRTGSRYT